MTKVKSRKDSFIVIASEAWQSGCCLPRHKHCVSTGYCIIAVCLFPVGKKYGCSSLFAAKHPLSFPRRRESILLASLYFPNFKQLNGTQVFVPYGRSLRFALNVQFSMFKLQKMKAMVLKPFRLLWGKQRGYLFSFFWLQRLCLPWDINSSGSSLVDFFILSRDSTFTCKSLIWRMSPSDIIFLRRNSV